MGSLLLVGLGRSVVLALIGLVTKGRASGLDTVEWMVSCVAHDGKRQMGRSIPSADAGVVVLGNPLVGLLGSTAGGGVDLVSDVVAGVLDGIHFD